MIESFVPGRVRLRSRLLTMPELAELLRGSLLGIQGVKVVTVNVRTGGLLLEYEPDRLPLSLLAQALPVFQRLGELEGLAAGEIRSALETALKDLKRVLMPD